MLEDKTMEDIILGSYISNKIKYYRELRGLTINALAYRSGVSQSYLRDIELGNKSNISVDKLYEICSELNITLSEFFNDNDLCETDPLQNKIDSMTYAQKNALLSFLDTIV